MEYGGYSPETIRRLASEIDFLAGLSIIEIQEFIYYATRLASVEPRAYLFEQGSDVSHVYIVLEGQVLLVRNEDHLGQREQRLRMIAGAGEMVGQYDFLYRQPHSTQARALEYTQVLEIRARALHELLRKHPQVRTKLGPFKRIGRLHAIPLLARQRITAISFLAEVASVEKIPAGQLIYGTDEPCKAIYVIDQGQVRLQPIGGASTYVANGMVFGFPRDDSHTLLDSGFHKEGATAEFDTVVFKFDPRQLSDITGEDLRALANRANRQMSDVQQTLAKQEPFANFTPDEVRKLCGYVSYNYYPNGKELLRQGEVSPVYFLVMPGSFAQVESAETDDAQSATLVEGPVGFNRQGLGQVGPSKANVTAAYESTWLTLHHDDLDLFEAVENKRVSRKMPLPRAAAHVPLRTRLLGIRPGNLQKNEILMGLYKRHWLVMLQKTSLAYVLGLFTLLFVVGMSLLSSPSPLLGWLVFVLACSTIAVWLWGYINYLNDFLIVTNQRILRQEMTVLNRILSRSAPLDKIQNVDVALDLAGRLLGYGNLIIRTASSAGDIPFDKVTHPDRIKQEIFDQTELHKQFYIANTQAVIQASLEATAHAGIETQDRITTKNASSVYHARRLSGGWTGWPNRLLRAANRNWTDQERVIWRKHWYVLLQELLLPLLILAPLIAIIVGSLNRSVRPSNNGSETGFFAALFGNPIVFFVAVALGLVLTIWIIWQIADWRNDTYEIDYKQIVDVEKLPLGFAEQRRTADLAQIQDITVDVPSPLNAILGFGDVFIQTAASNGTLTFTNVARPRRVADEIRRRMNQHRQNQEMNRASQRAQELQDWIEVQRSLEDEHETISSG